MLNFQIKHFNQSGCYFITVNQQMDYLIVQELILTLLLLLKKYQQIKCLQLLKMEFKMGKFLLISHKLVIILSLISYKEIKGWFVLILFKIVILKSRRFWVKVNNYTDNLKNEQYFIHITFLNFLNPSAYNINILFKIIFQ